MTTKAGFISTLHSMRSVAFFDLPEQLARNHECDACHAAVRAFHLRLVAEAARTSVVPAVRPALDGVVAERIDALRFREHGSVLRSEHDREDAGGLRGIGGIFGPELLIRVVVVDLPKELSAAEFKAAEV